jgi:hypothetical protein
LEIETLEGVLKFVLSLWGSKGIKEQVLGGQESLNTSAVLPSGRTCYEYLLNSVELSHCKVLSYSRNWLELVLETQGLVTGMLG